jgi:hypothetical protein
MKNSDEIILYWIPHKSKETLSNVELGGGKRGKSDQNLTAAQGAISN